MEEYIVSARKYRPLSFDSVVGQRALTTTLSNAIASGKLAHAYLFCGPRGVGKTTCARIFAKAINCMTPEADGTPCGNCESCRAFNEQRSMNIHELDAASNNSVEDIRELIQQVQIPPQTGRYKVFIIDEVHMLSNAAFNAFLKTLEEPPSYVIFILATTEKHKILPTILSRCQVYDFQRMTVQNTIDHLMYVAQKEGYEAEPEAMNLIAQKADGGMRDALSIFDQMVSFTGGQLTYERVCQSLNVLSAEYYFTLVEHCLKNEVEACLMLLNEVLVKGFDAGNFINGLASHMRDLLVSRDAKTVVLLEASEQMQARYQAQAQKCKPRFIYQAIKLCNDCDQAYRNSRNKRLQVEICLIQMAQLTEEDSPGSGLGPAKILKPIFQRLSASKRADSQSAVATTAQPVQKNTAVQPAPASPVPQQDTNAIVQSPASQLVTTTENTVAKPNPVASPAAPQLKKLKLKSFPGQKIVQEVHTQEETFHEKKTTPLQEDKVAVCWFEYIGQMPQSEKAMSMRMRDMRPEIIDDNTFRVMANNVQVAQDLQRLSAGIEAHFRTRLENDDARMLIEVAEAIKVERIYNKQERFRMMLERNGSLRRLTAQLNLRIN